MTRRLIILLSSLLICGIACAQAGADSARVAYRIINDYSTIGVHYGVALSRVSFNPNRLQQSMFVPVNFGITYTKYGKMFGYMPYFGFRISLLYTREGYDFIANADGIVDYQNYARKSTLETVEVPFMAHFHFDFWKMKIMADIGGFGGYRLSIHREYLEGIAERYHEYENSFHPLENRWDYGIKGGGGLSFVFDPIEIQIICYYKYSLSNLHQPDINDRTYERDDFSKYYYRWAYPTNTVLSVGIHYQLTRRTGRTRAVLRNEARQEAARRLREIQYENDKSENR